MCLSELAGIRPLLRKPLGRLSLSRSHSAGPAHINLPSGTEKAVQKLIDTERSGRGVHVNYRSAGALPVDIQFIQI
jgi:hypothetical protein